MTESTAAPTALPRAARHWTALASAGTLVGFVALLATFALLRPGVFLTAANLRNVLEQIAILGIIAFVQTVVMVVGDFDLSVGSVASMTGVVAASLMLDGTAFTVAVLVALGVAAAAGLVNGFLVAYVGVSAFVATLATMTSYGGVAFLVTDGSTLFDLPARFLDLGQGRLGPLPVPVVVLVVVGAATWFLLSRMTFGMRWYAIGGNVEASRLAGIDVARARLATFVVSGVGAGLAGVVLTSRLASAHPTAGAPFMLTSIAAVFLGMTMSREAEPNIGGTAIGVLILGVLSNGLNLLQVSSYVQQVMTGAIIVLAVSLSGLGQRVRP